MNYFSYFIVSFFIYYVSFRIVHVDGQLSEDFVGSMAAQWRFSSRGVERRDVETLFKQMMVNFSAIVNHVTKVADRLENRLSQLEEYALSSKAVN